LREAVSDRKQHRRMHRHADVLLTTSRFSVFGRSVASMLVCHATTPSVRL